MNKKGQQWSFMFWLIIAVMVLLVSLGIIFVIKGGFGKITEGIFT